MTDIAGLWTFDAVEERLVAALCSARRVPDRERSWLHVKAYWPDIREADIFDYPGGGVDGVSHIRIRPMPLSPAQVDQMEEAESWLGRFLDEGDRALVVLALGWLAAGRRIGWTRIARIMARSGPTLTRSALAQRYIKAIATVACGLNGKGPASIRYMVRQRLMADARRRAGELPPVQGRRVWRRRVEVDIVYSD